jgi:uncharacterized protein (TIGR00730 family)
MNQDINEDKIEEEAKLEEMRDEFENGIDTIKKFNKSVTFYGSTRLTEGTEYYERVRNLSYRISKELDFAILSGGGPGIMEASNRGAKEAGGKSIGLTIKLPREQDTNIYVTEEIPFKFFFTRQNTMSYSTEVCIFCPGGYGTLSELFDILTLKQTNKIGQIPVILYCSEFWSGIEEALKKVLLEKFGTIEEKDLGLYKIIDNEDEIIEIVKNSKLRTGEDALE